MEYFDKYKNISLKKTETFECSSLAKERSFSFASEFLFLAFIILFLVFVKFIVVPCAQKSITENTVHIVLGGEEC